MSKAQAQRPVRPSLGGLSAPGHQLPLVVASPQAGEWAVIVQAIHRCYRRAFPRRPRPPLARRNADEIVALLYRYWRDRTYRPSEAEIRGLRALEQRFNGEPEIGETKWLQRKDRR